MPVLDDDELDRALAALPSWHRDGDALVRAVEAESFLAGKKPEESVFAEAARIAASAAKPGADRRGTVEYKKEMARVLTVRALRKAAQRAAGR